jgi:uncharacterized protein YbjT (DUF2867 family)
MNSPSPTVLVTAATGTVGSALVTALRTRGTTVHAMTRTSGRTITGAETVVADLHDPTSITRALAGVDAAFLNSPSDEEAASLQIRFINRARDAGIGHLVLLSQYAADAGSPVRFLRWHAEVEDHLRGSGLPYTILRPNLFMQGFLSFAGTIAQGWFAAPIGDAEVSPIDARDIADVAAVVLTGTGHASRTYTLTGPRALTHAQIARAFSATTGRQITFHDASPDEFAEGLTGLMPPWQVQGLVEDYAHYARGEASEVSAAVPEITGHPARDLTDFAEDYAAAFSPATPHQEGDQHRHL